MQQTQQQPKEIPARSYRGDHINSTYWWLLKLDPGHPDNTTDQMVGYSKFIGFDEASDKQEMMKRTIVRLHSKEYFSKSLAIEFHRTQSVGTLGVNKNTDPTMWIMRKTDYSIENEQMLKQLEFIKFLNDFYQWVREGKDLKFLLPQKRAPFSKDDWLDLDKQFLRLGHDQLKLNRHFFRLVNNGHDPDAVTHFYRKYKEKYLR